MKPLLFYPNFKLFKLLQPPYLSNTLMQLLINITMLLLIADANGKHFSSFIDIGEVRNFVIFLSNLQIKFYI